jgi:N-acyl-D-amino-acid deacylase
MFFRAHIRLGANRPHKAAGVAQTVEVDAMARIFDKVIRGGTIFDGQRTPRFVSDIGIRDGVIAYIGDIRDVGAAEVIDARGLNVAPGFVDLHTHYDSQVFWDPYCTLSGWHGVTSVVIGNCGFGFAPCKPEDRERAMLTMARNEAVPLATMREGMPWDWESFPEFLDSLERMPKGVNILSYVPLSPVMMNVMGLEAAKNRPATAVERGRLAEVFNQALDAGACGFSAQIAGAEGVQRDYDGTPMITDVMAREDLMLFARILRDRGEGFIQIAGGGLDLAEQLAWESGRPIIWNMLAVGADQHGAATMMHKDAIRWLDDVNARGLRIFAQALTCNVGFTFTMEEWNLFDSSPIWRQVTLGPREERLAKMRDPAIRQALRDELDAGKGPIAGGGTEEMNPLGNAGLGGLFITETASAAWRDFEGCTVGEMARALEKHPVDAFLDLVVAEDLKTTFETPPLKLNDEAMKEVARSSVALPGVSDGGAHTKFVTLGAYPTEFLTVHVRQNNIMDLEEAHWRLAGYPAYAAGLKDRGVLREGMPADIVIYDLEALEMSPPEIAHDYPAKEWRRIRRAKGYRYIMVNGEVTFVDGECTGATPGRLLRHGYAGAVTAPTLQAAE